jgi:8-oxo-dGTP pyrophosphatase MutT (NUDIX family)
VRGGPQLIPRPPTWQLGGPAPWSGVERSLSLEQVTAAVAARGAGRPSGFEMAAPRHSAVLAALFDHESEPHVLLTRRSSALTHHAGQVSFPGGRMDPGETATDAALREAHEEVALHPSSVTIVGELDDVATVVSNSLIHVRVGVLEALPHGLVPNPTEVERIIAVPLADLADPEAFREELWVWDGTMRAVSFFDLDGETVWGATATMLRQLLVIAYGLERA